MHVRSSHRFGLDRTLTACASLSLLASTAFAACWVCPKDCTASNGGCQAGGTIKLCEIAARAAAAGEHGSTQLSAVLYQRRCWTYTGPSSTDWYQGPCEDEVEDYERLGGANCGTTGGACCFWNTQGSGGVSEVEVLDYQIKRCEGDDCTGTVQP